MRLVSYDISDNKVRTKFSKFLEQYGNRVQYSVFRIRNSKRVLNNIMQEIEHKYEKHFTFEDSIYIFQFCEACEKKVKKYGHAVYEDQDVIYFD